MKPISLSGSCLLAMVLSGISFAPPSGWGAETIPLASLDLTKATQGWGVSQANKSITGKTLAIAGRQFDRGFGTHADIKQRAKDNVSVYKRLRSVIAGGDCYHLTRPPSHENPAG